MRRLLKRAGGVAALGLAATLLPLMAASPASAAPGPQPPPSVTPNPVALSTTNFTLSSGTCDGTGADGWRVQTYILNSGVNPLTLAFDQGVGSAQVGTDRDNSNGSIQSPLFKGNVTGTGYNPGGLACRPHQPRRPRRVQLQQRRLDPDRWSVPDRLRVIDPSGVPTQSWSQTVTIDAAPIAAGGNFMVVGAAPGAPVIVDGPDDADTGPWSSTTARSPSTSTAPAPTTGPPRPRPSPATTRPRWAHRIARGLHRRVAGT